MMKSEISFTTFWRTLILRPKVFFAQYLGQGGQRPYFRLIISAYCAIAVLGAYLQPGIAAEEAVVQGYDQDTIWLATLLVEVTFRLLVGVLGYFMLGWFTTLLVYFSGGQTTFKQARSIVIYTYAAGITLLLPAVLFAMLLATTFPQLVSLTSLALAFVSLLFLGAYLTYIEYCGIVALTGAKKGRAIFWFCIFPFLVGTLLALLQLLGAGGGREIIALVPVASRSYVKCTHLSRPILGNSARFFAIHFLHFSNISFTKLFSPLLVYTAFGDR
ncbi:MAG: YIP1 family protein [Bacteroidota bacterium]